MEPESRYTLIGAMVLLLAAMLVGALMWLAGSGGGAQSRYYIVYFERQSLEGLEVGADVNMRGVRVGRVEDFAIARDDINRVKVLLRVPEDMPVSTNTEAVVGRQLVTGVARIDLLTPSPAGPPLDSAPAGEPYPVIAEGSGTLDELAASAGSLVSTAQRTLEAVNRLLAPANQQAVESILASTQQVLDRLDGRLDSVEQATQVIEAAAGAFRETAQTLSASVSEIAGGVGPLTRDADAAIRDLRRTLNEITLAARTMERGVSQFVRRADDATEIGVSEIQATARELRSGVDLLSRTLDRLQDPRAVLLGPGERQLGPGENR